MWDRQETWTQDLGDHQDMEQKEGAIGEMDKGEGKGIWGNWVEVAWVDPLPDVYRTVQSQN